MNRNELLAWTAATIGANGSWLVVEEEGPGGKKYLSFGLSIPVGDEVETERLTAVMGNGVYTPTTGRWEMPGYAACRGLLSEVWKFMSPSSRSMANQAIKHFKANR